MGKCYLSLSLTDGENEAQRGEINCSVLKGYRASEALRKAQIFAWMYLKISTLLFFVLLKILANFAKDLLECENGSRMPILFLYQRR